MFAELYTMLVHRFRSGAWSWTTISIDCAVIQHTGLNQIVRQPTRGHNILDRVFESSPIYCTVRVIASIVKSDHRAIVAYVLKREPDNSSQDKGSGSVPHQDAEPTCRTPVRVVWSKLGQRFTRDRCTKSV